MYYLTEKRNVTNLKRIEKEQRLTQNEYLNLLMNADNSMRTIHKTRYCLSNDNNYYEIDIYPEWNNQAIMEVELSNEDEVASIPPFIDVIKEVTEDEKYKNYNMAKSMPDESVKVKKI